MEDSEKRKEKLKAMRMEAAQSDVCGGAGTSGMPGRLSNPLADSSTMMPRQEDLCSTPRFDFYTDPMSAFSSNKRSKADQQIKQHCISSPSNNITSPTTQFALPFPGPMNVAHQMNNNPRAFQAQGHYNSVIPHMSPRVMSQPLPLHQGTSPEAWNGFGPPPVNPAPLRGPHGMTGPFAVRQANPEPFSRFRGQGNHNLPPNPGYSPQGSPGFNYGQGNTHWVSKTTSPGSGRGRGFGRGHTFNSHHREASGTVGAERFYEKSMEEDPWQNLKPVLWRSCSDSPASSSLKTPSSCDSWLPKSIAVNKPRVSEPSNKTTDGKQSLAEYLAASLDEAVNDESSV